MTVSKVIGHVLQMNIPAANDNGEEDSDEMELRMATTTANKAHSWRGDHPMKNSSGHFHLINQQPNTAIKYNKSKSYNPYKHNMHFPPTSQAPKSYHFGQSQNFVKPGSSSNPRSLPPPPPHHGGIRLVGLAPTPPRH